MTAPGMKRVNQSGRSTGRIKPHKNGRIDGPFIQHSNELLASPAWGVLKLTDRRLLDRLEVEHMAHGGMENGNLICTYSDFEKFGVRRASISAGLKRLQALGLIEIVEPGRLIAGEFRCPTKYRITYVTGNIPATNEWRKISSNEVAQDRKLSAVQRIKKSNQKQITGRGNATGTGRKNASAIQ